MCRLGMCFSGIFAKNPCRIKGVRLKCCGESRKDDIKSSVLVRRLNVRFNLKTEKIYAILKIVFGTTDTGRNNYGKGP